MDHYFISHGLVYMWKLKIDNNNAWFVWMISIMLEIIKRNFYCFSSWCGMHMRISAIWPIFAMCLQIFVSVYLDEYYIWLVLSVHVCFCVLDYYILNKMWRKLILFCLIILKCIDCDLICDLCMSTSCHIDCKFVNSLICCDPSLHMQELLFDGSYMFQYIVFPHSLKIRQNISAVSWKQTLLSIFCSMFTVHDKQQK